MNRNVRVLFEELMEGGKKDIVEGEFPTDKEVHLLHRILQEIIEMKYDPDESGEYRIDINLINRTTHYVNQFMPVPHFFNTENGGTVEDEKRAMEIAYLNLRVAQNIYDQQKRVFEHKEREESNK